MKKSDQWDQSLETGIGTIDTQHKIVFDLIGDLRKATAANADRRVIETLLDVVENYVYRHFEAEEEMIAGKEGGQAHCLEHYGLIKEFRKYRLNFRNRGNVDNTGPDFLDQWFAQHIKEQDVPLFAGTAEKASLDPDIKVDEYPFSGKERRKYKRIQQKTITDLEIIASCYNTTSLVNTEATVLNVSLGGIRLRSSVPFALDDLLVISCHIGKSFQLKEKVRVVNTEGEQYGTEFVGLSPETERFLVELYGSVLIRNY